MNGSASSRIVRSVEVESEGTGSGTRFFCEDRSVWRPLEPFRQQQTGESRGLRFGDRIHRQYGDD